jgi:DNA-directed RNA polymerase II subunit RPB1
MSTNHLGKKQPSKIIGLQFSILSPDEIRNQSVVEITTKETYINSQPVVGGLFDPRMGVQEPGMICPTDGLDYMQTPGYFGHIELARPVFYIQYLAIVLKIIKCVCFKCSSLLLNKNKYKKILNMKSKERWDYIYSICSKIKRCGNENENGCGCRQPDKIKKEGLSTITAEWSKLGDVDDGGDSKDATSILLSPEIIIKIFRRITDEDITYMGFSPTWSRPEWMLCQVLAVPPPAVRPSVKHDAQQRSEDDITHIIINIIKSNKTLIEKMEQNANESIINDWTTVLQYYIATMINNKIPGVSNVTQRSGRPLKSIIERLNGKTGRVRGNLMGKRVDYSARSVITPDANIGILELGVPNKIAMNITYPETINKRNKNYLTKMVRNGPDVYPGANTIQKANGDTISLRYVDRKSVMVEEGDIVARHMLNDDPILFNRQPTLHRMSMMCHKAKIMSVGNSFRMNVADTKPYNADFDGDEMNMHMPQNEESVSELLNLAAVNHHLISPGNNQPIVGIFQDSLLGAYRFTRENTVFTKMKTMNLVMMNTRINTTRFNSKDSFSSFDILSQILPPMTTNRGVKIDAGNYIHGQLDKSALGGTSHGLIHSINNDFGNINASNFIDDLQNIIMEYMKTSSYSVGVSDLISDEKTNNKIIEAITNKKRLVRELTDQIQLGSFENTTGKKNNDEFETKVNNILNKAQEEAGKIGRESLSVDNRFVTMVKAGSKGSNINIAQMISCLGQQNVDGKRIPYGYENRTLPHYTKYDDSPEARGFVENSFIGGLSPQELFFHAMGGRVGLIDTAVKTSQTGYIQRRLIKGMEDIKVHYDMTIRNNIGKIIQFSYGSDGFSTIMVENQKLPIISMTVEDIYTHFTINEPDINDLVFKNETITEINKPDVDKYTKQYIDMILNVRDKVANNIFGMENIDKIHIPVNFVRITENIRRQCNIKNHSFVDITPNAAFELITNTFERFASKYQQPSKLFKFAYFYYLTPRLLLIEKRFHKQALILLLATIEKAYKKAIVHPGEMVGMICAQSIGEPATQMTLNTFHFAGVASKSNVTRGVPRIEEILSLSSNPKNPSITVALKEKDRTNIQNAQEIMYNLEMTVLGDIVTTASIYFDPNDNITNVSEDEELMKTYKEYNALFDDCVSTSTNYSKWIIRLEFSKDEMINRNVTIDDVHYALTNVYSETISCVYSDLNAENIVFRIRMKALLKKKGASDILDQSDEIFILKNIQNHILHNISLKGISDINKVNMRKIQNHISKKEGEFEQDEIWVLDTVGSNLQDILKLPYIDSDNTTSNNIMEVYHVLGIEAARQTIYNEMNEVIEHDGTYINYHHIGLLCDRMTCNKKMVSIFRHGINNDNIGPIAKASFEETPEMFLRAARHAEIDNMCGVSANVMVGQVGKFGTGAFDVILDIDKIASMKEKTLQEEIDIDKMFDIENTDDPCAIEKISIDDAVDVLQGIDTGEVPDDYNIGF